MFEQERRFVPFSGKRYSVNYFGEVLDISGKVIETTLVENEHMVCLEWIMGKKLYSVGMIVLVSFGRIEVPEYL